MEEGGKWEGSSGWVDWDTRTYTHAHAHKPHTSQTPARQTSDGTTGVVEATGEGVRCRGEGRERQTVTHKGREWQEWPAACRGGSLTWNY